MSLEMYRTKPELMEAFCKDANATMQKGFAIDRMKEDPEAELDKTIIKSYVKDLRQLFNQNEAILNELQKDIDNLIQKRDLKTLELLKKAKIQLSPKTLRALEDEVEKKRQEELAKDKKFIKGLAEGANNRALEEIRSKPEDELAFYQKNLLSLKDELYALRESGEKEKTACLNDITAVNYWMIRVLKNENDDCAMMDAIKQMKSYDKALSNSCGEGSMRYIEWHGRIKPYVGTKLFQAEANCRQ